MGGGEGLRGVVVSAFKALSDPGAAAAWSSHAVALAEGGCQRGCSRRGGGGNARGDTGVRAARTPALAHGPEVLGLSLRGGLRHFVGAHLRWGLQSFDLHTLPSRLVLIYFHQARPCSAPVHSPMHTGLYW